MSYERTLRDALSVAASTVVGDRRIGQAARDAAGDVLLEAEIIPAMQATVSLIIALEELEDAAKHAAKRARDALRDALEATTGRVQTPFFTATTRAGPASVVITDQSAIPKDYVEYAPRFDRAALARALKSGARVPGVELRNGAPVLTIAARKGEAA